MGKKELIKYIQTINSSLKKYDKNEVISKYFKKIEKMKIEDALKSFYKKTIQIMFHSLLEKENSTTHTIHSNKHALKALELNLSTYIKYEKENTFISIQSDVIQHIKIFCKEYQITDNELYTCISNLIKLAGVTFPYKRFFIENISERFTALCNFEYTKRMETSYENPFYFIRFKTKKFFDFRFVQKRFYLLLRFTLEDYDLDIFSDIYNEEARIKAKRYDSDISVYDQWYDKKNPFVKDLVRHIIKNGIEENHSLRHDISVFTLREAIWALKAKECTSFKPTLALSIFKLYNVKKILDFSAGWGDRLIAAIAHNVEQYVAFDPNVLLQKGHRDMIQTFVPSGNRKKYMIRYEPFETARLNPKQTFDMVFTSPPYFNLEEYSQDISQSSSSFKTVKEWTNRFLITSVQKAWDVLEENGHMILHISDFRNNMYVEAMNLYIQWKCTGSLFLGVIGSIGIQGSAKPLWVWKKTNLTNSVRSKQASDHLEKYFPYVYHFWK